MHISAKIVLHTSQVLVQHLGRHPLITVRDKGGVDKFFEKERVSNSLNFLFCLMYVPEPSERFKVYSHGLMTLRNLLSSIRGNRKVTAA